jgi:hypothetical protein
MKHEDLPGPKRTDPTEQLEEALIDEFLKARGHGRQSIHTLPEDEARHLLTEASVYASSKLSEVEARAHYVHELHGDK